jgi:hypothetical protein
MLLQQGNGRGVSAPVAPFRFRREQRRGRQALTYRRSGRCVIIAKILVRSEGEEDC